MKKQNTSILKELKTFLLKLISVKIFFALQASLFVLMKIDITVFTIWAAFTAACLGLREFTKNKIIEKETVSPEPDNNVITEP